MFNSCLAADMQVAREALVAAKRQLVTLGLMAQKYPSCIAAIAKEAAEAAELAGKKARGERIVQKTEAEEEASKVRVAVPLGFDPMSGKLLPLPANTPPRVLDALYLHKAVESVLATVASMQVVCEAPKHDTLDRISSFLHTFAMLQPAPLICARSHMLLFLYSDVHGVLGKEDELDFQTLIYRSMIGMAVPNVLCTSLEGQQLIGDLVKPMYQVLRIFVLTRGRQRHRMEELFDEWSLLQTQSEKLDQRFTQEYGLAPGENRRYCSGWVLEQVLGLMTRHLMLGLELELYSIHELDSIFWYLDFVLGQQLHNRQMAVMMLQQMWQMEEQLKLQREEEAKGKKELEDGDVPAEDKGGSGCEGGDGAGAKKQQSAAAVAAAVVGKKKKKKGKKDKGALEKVEDDDAATTSESQAPISPLLPGQLVLDAERAVCRGLFRFIAALRMDGSIATPEFKYGSPELRFKNR
jgi:hypothetical protein